MNFDEDFITVEVQARADGKVYGERMIFSPEVKAAMIGVATSRAVRTVRDRMARQRIEEIRGDLSRAVRWDR